MTPPKVLGAEKPTSSVMINRTLGAALGGTTRGAHHAVDCAALSLMTPPNFGSGGGSCFPLMVVVALGEPGTPVVSWAKLDAATIVAAIATPHNIALRHGSCLSLLVGWSHTGSTKSIHCHFTHLGNPR